MSILSDSSIPLAAPFDAVAGTYDDSFSNSVTGLAQRRSVWMEMDRTFRAGQRILEVNCGTGIDAIRLAGRGVEVVACDSSPAMIAVACRRLQSASIRASAEFRCLPTEQLAQLETAKPYDGVISNFAGLNCIPDLRPVVRDLACLVRPGGKAILCLFGRFCLWETFYYAGRGDFRKAFRRFARNGVKATLAPGSTVIVRYWPVRSVRNYFSPYFRLTRWKGVGIAAPPSYLETLAVRFRPLFRLAAEVDPWLGRCPGLRALADHVVLTLERCSP